MTIFDVRRPLKAASDNMYLWFSQKCCEKSRVHWGERGGLGDSGVGAVYAFFDINGACLYVGQTTQRLKQRAVAEQSNHYESDWWESWETLRFLNIESQSDQIYMEILLILGLRPIYNVKPGAVQVSKLFKLK